MQNTQLGWLVCGSVQMASNREKGVQTNNAIFSLSVNLFCHSEDPDVNEVIPRF